MKKLKPFPPTLLAAYCILAISLVSDLYFQRLFDLSIGLVIAVLLTLFSSTKKHTYLIGSISIAFIIYSIISTKSPTAPYYFHIDNIILLLAILFSILIVSLHNKSIQELEETANKFESLFNYASLGIIVTNQDGEIMNFNHFAEKQFGYSQNEILGKKIETLIPASLSREHIYNRQNFVQYPTIREMGTGQELQALKKDGTEFPVEISLGYYSTGNSMYIIAFIAEISIRKGIEKTVLQQKNILEKNALQILNMNSQLEKKVADRTQMLQETLEELEKSKESLSKSLAKEIQLGEMKSRFVSMASHEFRTPLSSILSSAYLLEQYNVDDDFSTKRKKHLQRIKSSVSDMKSILEDFLSIGKLENGKVEATMKDIKLGDCLLEIQNTITSLQILTKQGQHIEFEHNGKEFVNIDLNILKNILSNLISNAIKFSPENSPIFVSYHANDQELILSVKDKGIGIEEADKAHLFERFFRGKNTTHIQGTGLGLHIVMKYVELMKGKIEFNSKINEGTEIFIHIPQHIPEYLKS